MLRVGNVVGRAWVCIYVKVEIVVVFRIAMMSYVSSSSSILEHA
jgi:hypothetical protein